jgi:predicted RNA-binding Zn-ribbon protein involved in translation (DUF1610 family)
MSSEFTTMKVSKDFRRSVDTVRAQIVQRGLNNAPESLVQALGERVCPQCHIEMQPTIAVSVMHSCPNCGMSKPVVELRASATQADDILKALGVTAILMLGTYLIAKSLE